MSARPALAPYQVLSLAELMEFYDLGELVDLQSFFTALANAVSPSVDGRVTFKTGIPRALVYQSDQFELIHGNARRYIELLKAIDLPMTCGLARETVEALNAAEITADHLRIYKGQVLNNLYAPLRNIAECAGKELGTKLVMVISNEKANFFQPKEPPFGKGVADKLENAIEDIYEASNCIAFGRYTACVFHLMRAMEIGVQRFGNGCLGVDLLGVTGREKQWQNIINDADKEIGKLDQNAERTKKFAAISANLYNVKLAWRNEVMHPKQTYTEEEALEVWAASRAFMRELSSVL